jgi:3-hydroxyisobutyrate dehydrogenase-like beta-hydroxyacid dehydrogenase
VQAFDVYPPSLDKAVKGGCVPCASPAETIKDASVLGLMVVNISQVEDLLFGQHQLASGKLSLLGQIQ